MEARQDGGHVVAHNIPLLLLPLLLNPAQLKALWERERRVKKASQPLNPPRTEEEGGPGGGGY